MCEITGSQKINLDMTDTFSLKSFTNMKDSQYMYYIDHFLITHLFWLFFTKFCFLGYLCLFYLY